MSPRPSPSFVVAVLALVLASGGVGYAAATVTSSQIVDNTVQGRDIANGTITNLDVANRSLARTKISKGCASGEVALSGGCVRRTAYGPSSQQAAMAGCHERNGRLPTIGELRWIASHPDDFTWADGNVNQYEFSSDWTTDYPHTPIGLDAAGYSVTNASGQFFWYRCVTS